MSSTTFDGAEAPANGSDSAGGAGANGMPKKRESIREFFNRPGMKRTLQIAGVLCALAVILTAFVALIGSFLPLPDPKLTIAQVYQIMFGIIMFLAEIKFKKLMFWFRFLVPYAGLGAFYIFIAVFSISDGKVRLLFPPS